MDSVLLVKSSLDYSDFILYRHDLTVHKSRINKFYNKNIIIYKTIYNLRTFPRWWESVEQVLVCGHLLHYRQSFIKR